MIELWFAIALLHADVFVVLDGWDFGAGALHLIVAQDRRRAPRGDRRHRSVLELARGLAVAAGGTFMLAFPAVMATRSPGSTSRSGWCCGRSSCAASRSRSAATSTIRCGSVAGTSSSRRRASLLAVLFGAALGNVIRGVPLDASGSFTLALFTDFGVARRASGILDWYTLSVPCSRASCSPPTARPTSA